MFSLKLILRAVQLQTNVNRVYEIYLSKGLFNTWVVTTANGRLGRGKGLQRTYSFEDIKKAEAFINKILRKRYNSKSRIGCNYELVQRQGDLKNITGGS